MTNASAAQRRSLTRSEAVEILVGLALALWWVAEKLSPADAIGTAGVVLFAFGLFGRRVFRWA